MSKSPLPPFGKGGDQLQADIGIAPPFAKGGLGGITVRAIRPQQTQRNPQEMR